MIKRASELYNKMENALVLEARFRSNIKQCCLNYCDLMIYSEQLKERKKHWRNLHKFIDTNY